MLGNCIHITGARWMLGSCIHIMSLIVHASPCNTLRQILGSDDNTPSRSRDWFSVFALLQLGLTSYAQLAGWQACNQPRAPLRQTARRRVDHHSKHLELTDILHIVNELRQRQFNMHRVVSDTGFANLRDSPACAAGKAGRYQQHRIIPHVVPVFHDRIEIAKG
jgi:hypothetical protein